MTIHHDLVSLSPLHLPLTHLPPYTSLPYTLPLTHLPPPPPPPPRTPGLDDYPRSPLPSESEYHVDLFCWMAKTTAVMARLETALEHNSASNSLIKSAEIDFGGGVIQSGDDDDTMNEGNSRNLAGKAVFDGNYQSLSEHLSGLLDTLHWSDLHSG